MKAAEITGKIVDLLTPLESEERRRVVSASLMLLGERALKSEIRGNREHDAGADDHEAEASILTGKAKTWLRQNALTTEQLDQAFHTNGEKTDVIASEMPGKNKKEQTLNAYVLTGIAQLLATGDPSFTDKDARALCTSAGCYDATNHSRSLNDKGNWFTGSREKGWTLTAPGLKYAAVLVKGLAAA